MSRWQSPMFSSAFMFFSVFVFSLSSSLAIHEGTSEAASNFTCTESTDTISARALRLARRLRSDHKICGGCNVPDSELVGNGHCNSNNPLLLYNTAECGFDRGDCCMSSCLGEDCSDNLADYDCKDPEQQDACQVHWDYTDFVGDGTCNALDANGGDFNSENCAFDGGDCCMSSCTGDCSDNLADYDCTDPAEQDACQIHRDYTDFVGDGTCNALDANGGDFNSENCAFDGGDCCMSSCTSEDCSDYLADYDCTDPAEQDACQVHWDYTDWIGDGVCDFDSFFEGGDFNSENCAFDGGDCCMSSCTGEYCSEDLADYDCTDPAEQDACQIHWNYTDWIGDGICDFDYFDEGGDFNSENCAFDGGDCCISTCSHTDCSDEIADYSCTDPRVTCDVKDPSRIGDKICDADRTDGNYNSPGCGYDGGDCCVSTCEEGDEQGLCQDLFDIDGINRCNDPTAPGKPCPFVNSTVCDACGYVEFEANKTEIDQEACDALLFPGYCKEHDFVPVKTCIGDSESCLFGSDIHYDGTTYESPCNHNCYDAEDCGDVVDRYCQAALDSGDSNLIVSSGCHMYVLDACPFADNSVCEVCGFLGLNKTIVNEGACDDAILGPACADINFNTTFCEFYLECPFGDDLTLRTETVESPCKESSACQAGTWTFTEDTNCQQEVSDYCIKAYNTYDATVIGASKCEDIVPFNTTDPCPFSDANVCNHCGTYGSDGPVDEEACEGAILDACVEAGFGNIGVCANLSVPCVFGDNVEQNVSESSGCLNENGYYELVRVEFYENEDCTGHVILSGDVATGVCEGIIDEDTGTPIFFIFDCKTGSQQFYVDEDCQQPAGQIPPLQPDTCASGYKFFQTDRYAESTGAGGSDVIRQARLVQPPGAPEPVPAISFSTPNEGCIQFRDTENNLDYSYVARVIDPGPKIQMDLYDGNNCVGGNSRVHVDNEAAHTFVPDLTVGFEIGTYSEMVHTTTFIETVVSPCNETSVCQTEYDNIDGCTAAVDRYCDAAPNDSGCEEEEVAEPN